MKLVKDMMLVAAGGTMVLMYQKFSKPVVGAASEAMSSMSKKLDDMVK